MKKVSDGAEDGESAERGENERNASEAVGGQQFDEHRGQKAGKKTVAGDLRLDGGAQVRVRAVVEDEAHHRTDGNESGRKSTGGDDGEHDGSHSQSAATKHALCEMPEQTVFHWGRLSGQVPLRSKSSEVQNPGQLLATHPGLAIDTPPRARPRMAKAMAMRWSLTVSIATFIAGLIAEFRAGSG